MKNFFLAIALFLLPASAQSQFLWQIEHTDFDGRYNYCFDAISCSGNVCIAAGRLVDNLDRRISMMIWRSTDNGMNWEMQDPHMPVDSELYVNNYFTAVQQIDPLNAIAVGAQHGDSSFILRTFDGGKTWQRQYTSLWGISSSIHFSDSLSGIYVGKKNIEYQGSIGAGFGGDEIFTTSDGGRQWDSAAFNDRDDYLDRTTIFCFGKGKFKVFRPGHGPIFSTTDNWKTADSSTVVIDSIDDPGSRYYFTGCTYTGGDTIIAYGADSQADTTQPLYPKRYRACIIRSTDGGKSWGKPNVFRDSIWTIAYMTSLDRDTVLAGGESNNKILMSTDRGTTWRVDSLIIADTAYTAYASLGLTFTSSGNPLAIYALQDLSGSSIPSIIVRGQYRKSNVSYSGLLSYNQRIYPNPATTTLNIVSVEASSPFKIVDVMGRTFLSGKVLDHNTLKLDISGLPSGIYYVLVERADTRGVFAIAGKVAVISH